jgi:hypothetical protein
MTGENKNGVMDPAADPRIDAALHVIGSATPESGLEGRILTRLAEERLRMEAAPAPSVRAAWLGHFPVRALGLVTACLMGFVIVTGSVVHSRRIKPDQMVSPPPLVLPAQGIGAACPQGSRSSCTRSVVEQIVFFRFSELRPRGTLVCANGPDRESSFHP